MSLMADALQPFSLAGFLSLRGRPEGPTVSDLVLQGNYMLGFDPAVKAILLDFRSTDAVTGAMAVDICRFSSAAFQTMASVPAAFVEKDALPWNLVRLYYAAFYAGHALCRLVGESCSQLDRSHITRLHAISTAIGSAPGFSLERGAYRVDSLTNSTVLRYIREDGAAHESFWTIFLRRVRRLQSDVLLGPLIQHEAQAVCAKLAALERVLASSGVAMGGSLRVVRNELQYRHAFDAWFPAKISRKDILRLGRLAAQWERDPMTIEIDAPGLEAFERFVVSCAFIVSVCRSLLLRIAARSQEGARSFICSGPISYLRTVGLSVTAA